MQTLALSIVTCICTAAAAHIIMWLAALLIVSNRKHVTKNYRFGAAVVGKCTMPCMVDDDRSQQCRLQELTILPGTARTEAAVSRNAEGWCLFYVFHSCPGGKSAVNIENRVIFRYAFDQKAHLETGR